MVHLIIFVIINVSGKPDYSQTCRKDHWKTWDDNIVIHYHLPDNSILQFSQVANGTPWNINIIQARRKQIWNGPAVLQRKARAQCSGACPPSLPPTRRPVSQLQNVIALKLLFRLFWSRCRWVLVVATRYSERNFPKLTVTKCAFLQPQQKSCGWQLSSEVPSSVATFRATIEQPTKAHTAFLRGLVGRILVRRPLDLPDLLLRPCLISHH